MKSILFRIFNSKSALMMMLFCSVLLITVFSVYSAKSIIQQGEEVLAGETFKVKSIIEDEVMRYHGGLKGARGALIADHLRFDPVTFKQYAQSREFFANFNGALGFGFIRSVKDNELPVYITRQKRQKRYFNVHPAVKTKQHMIIEMIEPLEENGVALGLDVAFEEHRREAALSSAASGQAALSKKIALVQRQNKHTGFLYFLPVYKTISTPTTESEREKQLLGWVYAPIVLDVLFNKIKSKLPENLNIDVYIGDGTVESLANNAIEQIPYLKKAKTAIVEVGGQTWEISVAGSTDKISRSLVSLALIYLLGVMLLILGSIMIYKNMSGKDRSIDEKTKWLNAIIDSAGYAVIAGKADGTITTFNATAQRMLGYSQEEILGLSADQLLEKIHDPQEIAAKIKSVSEEMNQNYKSRFEAVVARPLKYGSDMYEWTYIRKNGERFPVRIYITVIYDGDKKVIGFLGMAEDLSEHKKMLTTIEMKNAQIIESAKMSLLGEMASGIAHEINTPLAIIMGKASQLNEKIQGGLKDPQEISSQLTKIELTAERIGKIVKGLRLFSRDSARDVPHLVTLISLVESTLDLCREKIIYEDIAIEVDVPLNFTIKARPAEISQVLMNLISNAADAVAPLHNKWIKITAYAKGSLLFISITDSGTGVEKSVADKMMNPFFTTKEVGKGTGLGLSISKSIIESHEGQLYYNSSAVNTTFMIELPLQKLKEREFYL